jgi:hypothetical protein
MIMTTKNPNVTALIGFDRDVASYILADETVTKLVVFDDEDDENRKEYESMYPIHKDRLTFYEGSIPDLVEDYLENRGTFQRLEVLEKHGNLINCVVS